MLHSLQALASSAVMERLTLLINHVIAGEPIASQRLRQHAGSSVHLRFDGWPALLPPLPATAFRITPAGLVEWCGDDMPEPADLRVAIDASNPALAVARALTGERPRIEVAGDAQLATDVNWLFDNLRWDVEDDLARIVGQGPARELARLGQGIAGALREAVRTIGGLASRLRPGSDGRAGPDAR
jgi:ubiquinone biosynthesis accessory factor UbiJ